MTSILAPIEALFKLIFLFLARRLRRRAKNKKIASAESGIKLQKLILFLNKKTPLKSTDAFDTINLIQFRSQFFELLFCIFSFIQNRVDCIDYWKIKTFFL